MPDFTKIKTITSHTGYARFLAECEWDDDENCVVAGYIPTCLRSMIPSPYAYSPVTAINVWKGKKVFVSEVSHKRYEVYEVAPTVKRFANESDATDYHIRFFRHSA